MSFQIIDTSFPEAKLIQSFVAKDNRGMFIKDYSQKKLLESGMDYTLKEVFYTYSHRGVIRAIHFQTTKLQPKMIRVVQGSVFDVIVDLRANSATFGKWEGFYLNMENNHVLYVPPGFGHGYLVLEDSIVSYKCAEDFYPEYDSGIYWNDPQLNIQWPLEKINGNVILSDKDRALMTLDNFIELYKGL